MWAVGGGNCPAGRWRHTAFSSITAPHFPTTPSSLLFFIFKMIWVQDLWTFFLFCAWCRDCLVSPKRRRTCLRAKQTFNFNGEFFFILSLRSEFSFESFQKEAELRTLFFFLIIINFFVPLTQPYSWHAFFRLEQPCFRTVCVRVRVIVSEYVGKGERERKRERKRAKDC